MEFGASCYNPEVQKDQLLNPVKNIIQSQNIITETSSDEQVPLRLGFEESVTVFGRIEKSVFLNEMFLLDYQAIRSDHPNDPQMRLELSFFREALVRIMETEFYLTLILGQQRFEHIYSVILDSKFYEGVLQYHNRLQQNLNQSSHETRQMMMTTLLTTAVELFFIEKKEQSIEREKQVIERTVLGVEDDMDSSLLERMQVQSQQLMEARNQIFINQPWTMILFEQVSDQPVLKDLIIIAYQKHSSTGDIYLASNSMEVVENTKELLDHIYEEIQPVLTKSSEQMLERISNRVHNYRSNRKALFVHDLVQQQTLRYLKNVEDNEALAAYDEFLHQRGADSLFDMIVTAGAFMMCHVNKKLWITVALTFFSQVIVNILDKAAFKEALFKGVTFGLNSYLQYDLYDSNLSSETLIKSSLSAGTIALMCSRLEPFKITSLSIAKNTENIIRSKTISFPNMPIHSRQFLKNLRDKALDINALPSAIASLITFAGIECFRDCDKIWNEDFLLLFTITFIVEFVFVFKAINSGKSFISPQHVEAMQSIARTVFGISLSTQAVFSLMYDRPINSNLVFFEGVFGPIISLTATKLVHLYMVNPFSGLLKKSLKNFHHEIAVFSLMLLKNAFGNGLYLIGTDPLIDDEEEQENED